MCITPSYIWVERGPKNVQQPVACGLCWRCRSNRVSDYVGRSLCEASFAKSTCAITLTYAPRDDLADKVITPSHFQDFIRSLRKRGHDIRYLVVGEYGEMRGRAHFHALLFFRGEPLQIPNKINTHIDAWPHGHVFADWDADDKAVRYICKYLLKGKSEWFSISKKPPMGADFFEQKARRMAELGVWPTSFEYQPPFAPDNRRYLLTGATRRDYLLALIKHHGRDPDLASLNEWVAKAFEKVIKDRDLALRGPDIFEDFKEAFEERQIAKRTLDELDRRKKSLDTTAAYRGLLAETFEATGETFLRKGPELRERVAAWHGKKEIKGLRADPSRVRPLKK